MPASPDRFLRLSRRLDAAPARVFDSWVDPERMSQWLFASANDERYSAEVDARVGGSYAITVQRAGVTYTALGEYVELDRPRRLSFTFAMPQFSPNSDRVTLEFRADGAGCILTLTQEGTDIADELRQVPEGEPGGSEKGWREMLDALDGMLNAG